MIPMTVTGITCSDKFIIHANNAVDIPIHIVIIACNKNKHVCLDFNCDDG